MRGPATARFGATPDGSRVASPHEVDAREPPRRPALSKRGAVIDADGGGSCSSVSSSPGTTTEPSTTSATPGDGCTKRPPGSRLGSRPVAVHPCRDICGAPTNDFFRVPGELPADHCDGRPTVRVHEHVMHPGLQPVSLVVVSPGHRESDEPHGGHRSHASQGLRRLSGHRRVLGIQQQPQQRFRSLGNLGEGSEITSGASTSRPRRRRRLGQGRPQPPHHLSHNQTVSRLTKKIEPGPKSSTHLTKNTEARRTNLRTTAFREGAASILFAGQSTCARRLTSRRRSC